MNISTYIYNARKCQGCGFHKDLYGILKTILCLLNNYIPFLLHIELNKLFNKFFIYVFLAEYIK